LVRELVDPSLGWHWELLEPLWVQAWVRL